MVGAVARDADDPRLSFIPLDREAQSYDQVIKDHWWIVHPERGLAVFMKGSIQCNTSEDIARRLAGMYPWAEVRFIETVFIPHDCHDYL